MDNFLLASALSGDEGSRRQLFERLAFAQDAGATPLLHAVVAHGAAAADLLDTALRRNPGIAVSCVDDSRNTALHAAAAGVHLDGSDARVSRGGKGAELKESGIACAHVLLSHGSDPCAMNSKGQSPAHVAAGSGNTLFLALLQYRWSNAGGGGGGGFMSLAQGGVVQGSGTPGVGSWPALHVRDTSDRTLLHHACVSGAALTVEWLLMQGAEPGVGDGYGATALHYAVNRADERSVVHLLQAGAGLPLSAPSRGSGLLVLYPIRERRRGAGGSYKHTQTAAAAQLVGMLRSRDGRGRNPAAAAWSTFRECLHLWRGDTLPALFCWAHIRVVELQLELTRAAALAHAANMYVGVSAASPSSSESSSASPGGTTLGKEEVVGGASAPQLQAVLSPDADGGLHALPLPSSKRAVARAYATAAVASPASTFLMAGLYLLLHTHSHGAIYLWPLLSTAATLRFVGGVGPPLLSVAGGWTPTWQACLQAWVAFFFFASTAGNILLFHTRAIGPSALVTPGRRVTTGVQGRAARAGYVTALRTGDEAGAWSLAAAASAAGSGVSPLLPPSASRDPAAQTVQSQCCTCALSRIPRVKHCSWCGVCVPGFDHHCGWIGSCVAATNHGSFVLFVTAAAATSWAWAVLLVMYFQTVPVGGKVATLADLLNNRLATGAGEASGAVPLDAPAALVPAPVQHAYGAWAHATAAPLLTLIDLTCVLAGIFGVILLVQHARLISGALTTDELVKLQKPKSSAGGQSPRGAASGRRGIAYLQDPITRRFRNPFSHGSSASNCAKFWCGASMPFPCLRRGARGDRQGSGVAGGLLPGQVGQDKGTHAMSDSPHAALLTSSGSAALSAIAANVQDTDEFGAAEDDDEGREGYSIVRGLGAAWLASHARKRGLLTWLERPGREYGRD